MKNILVGTMLVVVCVMLGNLLVVPLASAQDLKTDMNTQTDLVGKAYNQTTTGGTGLMTMIGNIIRTILTLLGVVVLVLVVYAGFLWMTAGGDPEKVKTAKTMLTNAIIGLALILAAYAISDFVVSKLFEATTDVAV